MAVKPGQGYRGTGGRIGYILRQAQHSVRMKINEALKAHEMTHPQFAVLSILDFEKEVHSADIARISMFSPQSTNVIINKLEKEGYIEKRPHPTHGRVLNIYVTEKGQQQLTKTKKCVHDIEAKMLDGLSDKDEQIVRQFLLHCTQL